MPTRGKKAGEWAHPGAAYADDVTAPSDREINQLFWLATLR
jgi:hypothetical protein